MFRIITFLLIISVCLLAAWAANISLNETLSMRTESRYIEYIYQKFGEDALIRPYKHSRYYVLDKDGVLWYVDIDYNKGELFFETKYPTFEINRKLENPQK